MNILRLNLFSPFFTFIFIGLIFFFFFLFFFFWFIWRTRGSKTTFDEVQNNIKEAAVPTGGTAGQVLAKNTDTDNDVKWVDQAGGTTGDTLPIGSIISYPKAVAPENWLICDGSAVSRTDYSKIFNVIKTTFGTGDGSTTFNLSSISFIFICNCSIISCCSCIALDNVAIIGNSLI